MRTLIVRKIVSNVDVNAKTKNGTTALHIASWKGSVAGVRFLIKNGANVNAKDNVGDTPFMYACFHGHTEVVKLFLDAKVNVNATNDRNCTILMLACFHGYNPIVKLLLQAKADVNVKEKKYGTTALMYATYKKHISVMNLLLFSEETKGKINIENIIIKHNSFYSNNIFSNYSALDIAVKECNSIVAVRPLIFAGASISKYVKEDEKTKEIYITNPLVKEAYKEYKDAVKKDVYPHLCLHICSDLVGIVDQYLFE